MEQVFETEEADTSFKLFVDSARSHPFLTELEGNMSGLLRSPISELEETCTIHVLTVCGYFFLPGTRYPQ